MKLTEQKRLNQSEEEAIRAILKRSREKEPFSLTFPFRDPGTRYFIAKSDDDKTVFSVLALISFNQTSFEVSAVTDPCVRKNGYFHLLWEKAKRSLPGKSSVHAPVTVCFALDTSCKDALPVLSSIGASLKEEESEMRCDLSEKPEPCGKFHFRHSAPSGEGIFRYEALSPKDERPVLQCYVMPMKDAHCYLHRVAVRKDLIGTGIGSSVFPELLSVLKKQGYKKASLQVTSSNLPAVKLYEANGFSVSKSLRFYECRFD